MGKKKELIINSPHSDETKEPESTHGESKKDPKERDMWANQCEFFLSCLGFAVGFGNVWRFPYLCYKNGGAAFLIPFVIMLLVAGIPLFFMELVLGQYVSMGPNILFPELVPIFSGIGWAMLVTTGLVSIYYNMVFAWSLFYMIASFTTVLPWGHCENEYNSINCFTHQDSIKCKNQSTFYYNKSCLTIDSFCNVSGMTGYNKTHCSLSSGNGSILQVAEEAVQRISASEDFYKNRMLEVTGTSWDDLGSMRWELVGCLAVAWAVVGICLIKGVQSSGKVVYVSAISPYVVLTILFIRGITLDGAYQGIEFYILKPNMTKLYEIQVWNDAATQLFYSLSTGFGGLITLSSYSKFKNNCMRDAIIISVVNCLTSVYAGFVIFSVLGFMAKEINVPVDAVVDSGSGLAFIAYPAAVARMPYPPIWSALFFLMLIVLGLDSQFTFVETLATGVFDSFESTRSRKYVVVLGFCITLFLAGLPLCLQGGVYMFELLDYYAAGLSVLFIAICEVICVTYIYGYKKFMRHITDDIGISMSPVLRAYWSISWFVLTPASLIMILVLAIYFFEPYQWGTYVFPLNIQILGAFITIGSMAFIPIFFVYVLFCSGKRGKELIQPTEKFCPAYIRKKQDSKNAQVTFKYLYDNEGFTQEGGVQIVPSSTGHKGPTTTTNKVVTVRQVGGPHPLYPNIDKELN